MLRLKNLKSCAKDNKGLSIIEVLVAIGILSITLSGIFLLVFQVSNVGTDAEARTLAINYAQEAIDVVRNIKENSPCNFFDTSQYPDGDYTIIQNPDNSGNWELKKLSDNSYSLPHWNKWADIYGMGKLEKIGTGMYSKDPDNPASAAQFEHGRIIHLASNGPFPAWKHKVITVTVSWKSKGVPNQKYQTQTLLMNWKY